MSDINWIEWARKVDPNEEWLRTANGKSLLFQGPYAFTFAFSEEKSDLGAPLLEYAIRGQIERRNHYWTIDWHHKGEYSVTIWEKGSAVILGQAVHEDYALGEARAKNVLEALAKAYEQAIEAENDR